MLLRDDSRSVVLASPDRLCVPAVLQRRYFAFMLALVHQDGSAVCPIFFGHFGLYRVWQGPLHLDHRLRYQLLRSFVLIVLGRWCLVSHRPCRFIRKLRILRVLFVIGA